MSINLVVAVTDGDWFAMLRRQPDHQFEVSGRIEEEFENGRDYYGLHGKSIYVPKNVAQKPDSAALS